ncbi:bifunctional ADP-dependent [Sesbania bispinosa]|nr:bifunctional ADP-dependent [Sesbania bispinosa]
MEGMLKFFSGMAVVRLIGTVKSIPKQRMNLHRRLRCSGWWAETLLCGSGAVPERRRKEVTRCGGCLGRGVPRTVTVDRRWDAVVTGWRCAVVVETGQRWCVSRTTEAAGRTGAVVAETRRADCRNEEENWWWQSSGGAAHRLSGAASCAACCTMMQSLMDGGENRSARGGGWAEKMIDMVVGGVVLTAMVKRNGERN